MPAIPEQFDDEELDVGPLTKAQMRSLARDQISALRSTSTAMWEDHKIACDMWLMDRLEYQLCRDSQSKE